MPLYSGILADKEINGTLFQPFQIFFQKIVGDHMHGFIFSKFLQSLADTFYSMAGNINTGKVRIKLQKLFHDLGCHPLIIVRIPDIHNFNSRKALLDLCS